MTGFVPDFEIQISEIEFDIKEEHDEYENTKWLRFIIPINKNWNKDIINFDLTTDIYVPNPLRGCPSSPKIIKQGIKNNQNIENLQFYEWNHYIDCETDAAEQDTLHFTYHMTI